MTTTGATPNSEIATVTVNYDFSFVTPLSMFAGMFGATPAGVYDLTSTGVVTCPN